MSDRETITAWITKYALTSGVQKVEAKLCAPDMISVVQESGFSNVFYGKEWHTTPAAAAAHVEIMRARKIASLKKDLEKLENMKIEVQE